MHTARSTSTLLSLLALAVACSSEHEPTITQPPAPTFSASRGVEYSVSGGGIVDFTTAGVGVGHFSFNAELKGDGTAHGRFHQRRETGETVVDFSGIVTCVTIDPVLGRARIGGIVTENKSTNPNFLTVNHEVGDDVWFRVEDGGEGAGAIDASTTYGFKPTLVNTSAEYCALPFTGATWNPATTFPLRSGNIQVRP
jgi:hypothetical protein